MRVSPGSGPPRAAPRLARLLRSTSPPCRLLPAPGRAHRRPALPLLTPLTKHAGGDARERLGGGGRERGRVQHHFLPSRPPPHLSPRLLPRGGRPGPRPPRPPHHRAELVFQQQVEAAQVAAAELGGLAGAGLSVGDGPHRVDDICRRRRGQAGRGLPAVLGSPLPAWALDETGNGPSTPRELRGSPGEDLTFAGIQVCPWAPTHTPIDPGPISTCICTRWGVTGSAKAPSP